MKKQTYKKTIDKIGIKKVLRILMLKHRRHRKRGMTLIEIMTVVLIMGMIATGVTIAVMKIFIGSKEECVKTDVSAVRSAASIYSLRNRNACPTVDDLVKENYLSRHTRAKDPWGNPFVIVCSGPEVEVISFGPDGEEGTEDDIR